MHSINALAVRATSFLAQHSIARCQVWHCEERKRHLRKLKLRSSNFVAKCECFVLARKAAAHEAVNLRFTSHFCGRFAQLPISIRIYEASKFSWGAIHCAAHVKTHAGSQEWSRDPKWHWVVL